MQNTLIGAAFSAREDRVVFYSAAGNPVIEVANPDDTVTGIEFTGTVSGVVREERLFRNGAIVQASLTRLPVIPGVEPTIAAEIYSVQAMSVIMRADRPEQEKWKLAA